MKIIPQKMPKIEKNIEKRAKINQKSVKNVENLSKNTKTDVEKYVKLDPKI